MNRLIQTVTGPIEAAQMGRTFCHEHLIIGYAGWEGDLTRSGPFDPDAAVREIAARPDAPTDTAAIVRLALAGR